MVRRKAIQDYGNGMFEIGDDGNIYYPGTDKTKGQKWDKKTRNKYKYVHLAYNGYATSGRNKKSKKLYIHRLVAQYFIENPDPETLDQVNHKDGDKHNNHYTNLEWSNNRLNVQHAFDNGLNRGTTGKRWSEETKAKMSRSQKLAWARKTKEEREEFSRKARERQLGKTLSEETRRKLSKSNRDAALRRLQGK